MQPGERPERPLWQNITRCYTASCAEKIARALGNDYRPRDDCAGACSTCSASGRASTAQACSHALLRPGPTMTRSRRTARASGRRFLRSRETRPSQSPHRLSPYPAELRRHRPRRRRQPSQPRGRRRERPFTPSAMPGPTSAVPAATAAIRRRRFAPTGRPKVCRGSGSSRSVSATRRSSTADGRAFTIEQRRDQEVVTAYDIDTGREVWAHGWKALLHGIDGRRWPARDADVSRGAHLRAWSDRRVSLSRCPHRKADLAASRSSTTTAPTTFSGACPARRSSSTTR